MDKNNRVPKDKLLESFYSSLGESKIPVKTDGQVIGYWSKDLGNEFIKSINNNRNFTSNVKDLMITGINKKAVIPVYTHSLWLLDITENFFKIFTGMSGSIMGFYDGHMIVLMTSNLRDITGNIEDKTIYGILTHEFQHRFAGEANGYANDPKVKDLLNKWFNEVLTLHFGTTLPKDVKDKLMKFFTNIGIEANRSILKGAIEKRFKELYNIYDKTDEDAPYYEKLEDLLYYVYYSYEGQMRDMSFYNLCQRAYKNIGITPDTWIFQEFLIPSEVICVCASNDTKIGNYFLGKYLDKIKLGKQ